MKTLIVTKFHELEPVKSDFGARRVKTDAPVIGVSAARFEGRGSATARGCHDWFGAAHPSVKLDTQINDGSYGVDAEWRRETFAWGWRHGLALDMTNTSKALKGLRTLVEPRAVAQQTRILFWNNDAQANHLADAGAQPTPSMYMRCR